MTRFGLVLQLVALWLVALGAIGCASPIVGGECKDGHVICGGRCVRLEDNFMHCGACDNECSAIQVCRAGQCVASLFDGGEADSGDQDGGGGTSGSGGTSGTSGSSGDGGTGGIVVPPDASFPGCGIDETDCSGQCVIIEHDPQHCGMCGNACAVGEVCQAGTCVAVCSDPFTFCPAINGCVDLSSDPRNCGSCGRRCMSGLCSGGQCEDAVPGHLIVIGHDYGQSNATMDRLLRSSVFLASGAPVPALVYEGTSSDATVARINAVIEASLERTWQPQVLATSGQLGFLLKSNGYRLFVVYPQAGESDEELKKIRSSWTRTLADFLIRGGVVVVFEHNPSDLNGGVRNAGTHQLLGCKGATTACTPLFQAESVMRLGTAARLLINYEDGWITNGVPSAYAATRNSMAFGAISTPGNLVAVDETSGDPVIVHRLLSAPPEMP